MEWHFEKICACGNDFILVNGFWPQDQVGSLCDRYHGIGADGVMAFEGVKEGLVQLKHWDPDGSQSFCLNGTRAALQHLRTVDLIPDEGLVVICGQKLPYVIDGFCRILFPAFDIQKKPFNYRAQTFSGYFLDVGNPQLVFLHDQMGLELFRESAPWWRGHPDFKNGSNVNWCEKKGQNVVIHTFERGVEGFTKACGSGILATATVLLSLYPNPSLHFQPEGHGWVKVERHKDGLMLYGPTQRVFSGVARC